MADNLVVQSKIKELVKSEACSSAADLIPALNEAVEKAVRAAVARAKSNKRKTVRGADV